MEIKDIDIKLLKPNDLNPRVISNTNRINLYNSIKEFGDVGVIVIDKDYNILSGHQRYSVFKSLGYKKVRCLIADHLDEKQKLEFMIDINSQAGTGYYVEKGGERHLSQDYGSITLYFSSQEKLQLFVDKTRELIEKGVGSDIAEVLIKEILGE